MLARHGITEQQWRVIRVLAEAGPLGATDLALRAAILGPSLTRIIKTLEKQHMITSRRLPNDGRRVVLQIAPAGSAIIKSATAERRLIYQELERRHGRDFLSELLDRLEILIRAETEDGKGIRHSRSQSIATRRPSNKAWRGHQSV